MHSIPRRSPAAPALRPFRQLWLHGIDWGEAPTDRLFFALFPSPAAAATIAAQAHRLRTHHGLEGDPLLTHRFHVSLHHLGDYFGLPPGLVATAREAATAMALASFDVSFDRALSFRRNAPTRPLVLRSRSDDEPLKRFHQDLRLALIKAGIGHYASRRFTPHVTLLYDAREVAEQKIDAVRWTVREFVLVHSLIGQTEHRILGRWALRVPTPLAAE
jgi:RNA 2',3'-cyclic 3'-phosphodiesterase